MIEGAANTSPAGQSLVAAKGAMSRARRSFFAVPGTF